MENLPKITEKDLKSLSSANSFARGQDYYKSRSVQNAERDGMVLRAEVEGSEYQPYRVSITFDETGIEEAGCTCPYDYGGFCKHQIAVILQYIREPESFVVHSPIAQTLANHSREELIVLIERMIEREPELRNLLSTPIPGKKARQSPVNVEGYRRELQRYINNYEEDELIRSIRSIMRNARDFAKAGDYANAISIYGCILEETVADENFEYWGEWELFDPLTDVLTALENCMKAVQEDADLRRKILMYWLKARAWDLVAGGIGFAENTEDWTSSYVKAEDVPFIRPIIEKATRNEWAQEPIEEFLAQLDLLEGKDPEASYQRMLEKGLYSLYFEKMLDAKRLEEALSVWKHFSDYERATLIPYLASNGYEKEAREYAETELHQKNNRQILGWLLNEYVRQGQDEKAVSLAELMFKKSEEKSLVNWLIDHHASRKNAERVLYWNRQRFQTEPSLEHYSALKAAAQALNQWDSIEPEILKSFQKNYVLLTRIHELEKRWDTAWESLERAKQEKSSQRSIYGYMLDDSYGLDLELAEAAKEHTPEKSIAVYLRYARRYIEQRQRGSYAQAAQYLKVVQTLYLKTLKQAESWQNLINGLRDEFKTLRAMQDEFQKAGLYK